MNLSIVYSTRREKKNFSRHIQKSCGLKNVQILAYVNDGRKSLSEVYNQGLAEAGNDLIVFMHDDLGFEERGWGRKIIKHFQNSGFGILGVAGAAALPETGVWWQDPGRTIGIVKHRHNGKTWLSKYSRNFKDKIIPAVCVDGLFIAVNRNRLRKNFDGEVTGFHFYDIAFCMDNHLAGVKTGVIFDVRITHKSIGQTGEAWERSRERFVSARKHMLPCAVKAELVFEEKTIELKNPPKLSVIIPHKSNNFLLFNCLNSFAEKSRYPNYEVIVADTGSSSREQDEIHEYADATMMDVKIVKFDSYHFGRVNNSVAFNHLSADSELILFCNNDIELINDAVTRMVQVYIRYKAICGTVGCRLHFANNTIQHAGIHLARNERDELVIGHKGFRSYYNYFEGTEKNVLGSTAAFLLIERALFEKLTGFNPAYEHCLEDVELNLACLKHGKKNYFAGDAVCYHFESQTRTDSGTITPGDYENLLKFIQKNPCIRDYDYVGPLCSSTQPGYNGGTKNNG